MAHVKKQRAEEYVSLYGPGAFGRSDMIAAYVAGWNAREKEPGQDLAPLARDRYEKISDRLEVINKCHAQAVGDTSAHADDYHRGYTNGIILAHAVMHGIEASFVFRPEAVGWLDETIPVDPSPDRVAPGWCEADGFGEGVRGSDAKPTLDDGFDAGLDWKDPAENVEEDAARETFMAEVTRMMSNAFSDGFEFSKFVDRLYKR